MYIFFLQIVKMVSIIDDNYIYTHSAETTKYALLCQQLEL